MRTRPVTVIASCTSTFAPMTMSSSDVSMDRSSIPCSGKLPGSVAHDVRGWVGSQPAPAPIVASRVSPSVVPCPLPAEKSMWSFTPHRKMSPIGVFSSRIWYGPSLQTRRAVGVDVDVVVRLVGAEREPVDVQLVADDAGRVARCEVVDRAVVPDAGRGRE